MKKYKIHIEQLNIDMEVVNKTVFFVEGKNRMMAQQSALKKIQKQNPHIDPGAFVPVHPISNRERNKILPVERLIKYLKTQIAITRLNEKNTEMSRQTKYISQTKRVMLKLCLYQANKALEHEKELI